MRTYLAAEPMTRQRPAAAAAAATTPQTTGYFCFSKQKFTVICYMALQADNLSGDCRALLCNRGDWMPVIPEGQRLAISVGLQQMPYLKWGRLSGAGMEEGADGGGKGLQAGQQWEAGQLTGHEAGEGCGAGHGHEEGARVQLELHRHPLHLVTRQARRFCSQAHLHI